MDESRLIGLALAGEEDAWERLVREHEQAVFRLAYLMVGSAVDAEDVAQETFIRAFRALKTFDRTRPLRPWLLRIAANLVKNRWRALGRYLAAVQRLIQATPAPEAAQMEEAEDAQELWRAIRRLSKVDQEVIYLRYFLELPEAEAAEALGVAVGTVKSRLHRALLRLRAVVEQEFPMLQEGREDERATV